MIASWMLASTLFAALLGVAALAAERALRTAGRQARGAWLIALVGAVGWTAGAPAIASAVARLSHAGARAPVGGVDLSVVIVGAPPLVVPAGWAAYLDVPLVALWTLASFVMLASLVRAVRALSRMERTADRDVIDGVSVLVTESVGPAVFGTRRSRVLVPRWLLELDAPLRKLVLRHEQEHCRARDPQLTLAVAVALVLMPWNAGVWWIARRLRLAVEVDCDARVLRGAYDTERYSKLLLFIAQRQSLVRLAPMLAESNSHLGRRIAAMNAHRPHHPRTRSAAFAVFAACALALSTKFATELTAAPAISLRAYAGRAERSSTPPEQVKRDTQQVVAAASESRPETPSSAASKKPVVMKGAPAAATVPAKFESPKQGPGDRGVMVMPGSPAPRYPDILKQAGVEGGVLVAFVVDTNGTIDPQSVKFFISTHQLFAEAVKAALPNMRFLPAIVNGSAVRQGVRMPVAFNLLGSPLASEEGQRAAIERLVSDVPSSDLMTLGAMIITGIVP